MRAVQPILIASLLFGAACASTSHQDDQVITSHDDNIGFNANKILTMARYAKTVHEVEKRIGRPFTCTSDDRTIWALPEVEETKINLLIMHDAAKNITSYEVTSAEECNAKGI